MSDLTGQTIRHYELHDCIGEGASGSVFRGTDTHIGEPVAIKHLKTRRTSTSAIHLERFQREGRLLREMDHPNIVKLLDTFEEDNQYFIVMEYMSGGSLRDLLGQQPQLPLEQLLWIALDLADALTRAHRLEIIHRDLKPENVLIAKDGTPRLTDFGIAYLALSAPLTLEGALIGTPRYLSPEAINGQPVDARADIWSFGVLLFEMLAGHVPFEAELMTQLFYAILHDPIPDLEAIRPDAPIALVDLIYRMLEKDPRARIPSVRIVGTELETLLRTEDLVDSVLGEDIDRHTFDGSSVFATPTPAADAPQHNLPVQTTLFVGREDELAELARLTADPDVRLITILGPGGMGKTRLALEAAEQQVGAFERGVWFVSLAPLSDPAQIVSAIAEAVGLRFYQDGGTQREQLMNYLRAKEMLLVLDNFEHLLEGADFVHEILCTVPGVKVLITSRAKLNLGAEVLVPISGIEFPDWETPEDALEYSAVKLFMQSARRVLPSFTLGVDHLPYVARICRLVAGMPLGILLAAAWVDVLSPQEIANEITHSLDFLSSERRDLEERHRSIRAVFDSSRERLDNAECAAAIRMSIFRGGFTRDAAQHVAKANLRMLATLVSKSMLQRDPHTGRYNIHELLRQYLQEKLDADLDETQRTLATYCTYYADYFFKQEGDFYHASVLEVDNLHQTWDIALERGDMANLRKFRLLGRLYNDQGWSRRGFELYAEAVDAVRQHDADGEQPIVLGNLLMWQAWFSQVLERIDLGKELYRKSLDTLRPTGENWEHAVARMMAVGGGVIADREEGRRMLEQSHVFFEHTGDRHWYTNSFFFMATHAALGNETDEAKYYLREMVTVARDIKDLYREILGLFGLGNVAMRLGQFEEARAYYEQVVEGAVAYQAPRSMTDSLNTLTYACLALNDLDAAEHYVRQAIAIAEDIGDPITALTVRDTLADVVFARGAYREAQEMFEYVLEELHEHDLPAWVANVHNRIAYCALELGDRETARTLLERALAEVRAGWPGPVAADTLIGCAAALVYDGEYERALGLIALTEPHPLVYKHSKLEARLKAEIAATLPPDVFAAAWARGQALDLDTTIQALIDELAHV